jgi:APA family basic amino acid/polyamine antiporter
VFTALMLVQYFTMGTFQRLMNYVMFTDSLSLAFGAACVYVLARNRNEQLPLSSRFFHVVTPAVFIAIMLVVTLNVTLSEPANALAGLAVFTAGAAVFALRRALTIKGKKV